ncbi:MBL fold metallo-hydrolase [Lacisediminihabitans sp. H27-G8]|uniref:MBL fold metallo-hydrolase n=1 Tax=Lacisediminihabitans sp. H27-G8 TaxID=3111909 RepID=UPI0038FD219A
MKLTILGTSAPYPRPDNACSGYLVQQGRTSVWVDAGTGTLAELQRHIPLSGLDAIWISHAHADHTADLLTAYYALRFADLRLPHPLPLIGPPGLIDRMVGFLGHRSAAVIPEVFDSTEMRGWHELVVGELALSWGPLDHGMPAFGLRVEAAGSVLAYSGDSAYCEGLVELAEGADLFLCEAGASVHPPDGAVHCTPEDAARLATAAGAKRLLLTHVDAPNARERALAGFPSVELAVPGMTIEV